MDCGVEKDIQKAVAEFEVLLREQVARNERIRKSREERRWFRKLPEKKS